MAKYFTTTCLVVLVIGYLIGVLYPSMGNSVVSKFRS